MTKVQHIFPGSQFTGFAYEFQEKTFSFFQISRKAGGLLVMVIVCPRLTLKET